MPWNHRVLRHKFPPIKDVQREDHYIIHEVYFNEGKQDEPHSCTKDGVEVRGESIEELRETLQRMLRCLDHPVLDYDVIAGRTDEDAEDL
jgi:hypothetical protein